MGPAAGEGYLVIGTVLTVIGIGWIALMDEVQLGFLGWPVVFVGVVALAIGIVAKGVQVGHHALADEAAARQRDE